MGMPQNGADFGMGTLAIDPSAGRAPTSPIAKASTGLNFRIPAGHPGENTIRVQSDSAITTRASTYKNRHMKKAFPGRQALPVGIGPRLARVLVAGSRPNR